MSRLKKVIAKVFGIETIRTVFLIASFLYIFPLTNVITSKAFKVFIIWALCIIVYNFALKKKLVINNKDVYLLVVIVICSFITDVFNVKNNFIGNIIITSYMFVQNVLLMTYDINDDNEKALKELKRFSVIVVTCTFICAIISFLIYVLEIDRNLFVGTKEIIIVYAEGRLWSIYGNPNALGQCSFISIMYSILLLVLERYETNLKRTNKVHMLIYLNILLELICLILSNSRSAFLATICSVFVLLILFYSNNSKYKGKTFVDRLKTNIWKITAKAVVTMTAIITVFLLIRSILPYSINIARSIKGNEIIKSEHPYIKRNYDDQTDISNGRTDIWKAGGKVFLEHPLVGVGIKNVNSCTNVYMPQEAVEKYPTLTDSLHNIYLHILVSYGLLGFIVFTLYALYNIKKVYRYINELDYNEKNHNIILIILTMIVFMLVVNFFETTILHFFNVFLVTIFWFNVMMVNRIINLENIRKTKIKGKSKLLFLIDTLGGGGAEKVLVDVVNNLSNTKYDIEVRTVYNEGIYKTKLNKNIKYSCIIKKPTLWKKRIINNVVKYLPSEITYNLFINDYYNIEISFLELLSNKILSGSHNKKITWIHTDIFEHEGSTSYFANKKALVNAYKKYNKLVFVSDETKNKFIIETGIKDNILTIYNPLDTNKIKELANESCEDRNDKDTFVISSVGRLNSQKGYLRLCEVANKLNKDKLDFVIEILGEGEERPKIEKYITDNDLGNKVKLLGFKENPYKYVKKSDLFISCSLVEGFSLAVAEALVIGVPVISTNTSGPSNILKKGEYGLIIDNTEESIYNCLNKILTDEKQYNNLRIRCSNYKCEFEIRNVILKIEKLLENVSNE